MTYITQFSREDITALKHQGSYKSGILLRLFEYLYASPFVYSGMAPISLTMMLLGGYMVKTKQVFQLKAYTSLITKPFLIIFGTLFIFRFAFTYWILPSFEIVRGSALSITLFTLFQLSDIAICLFYVWSTIRLLQHSFFKRILTPLKYVGRTALSNYILQSIIGYLIMRTFNGYGTFGAFGCSLIVTGTFPLQILLSKIWLKYYQFGPLEWCWRCLSYKKRFSLMKASEDTV
jgi:uncharacterized protein